MDENATTKGGYKCEQEVYSRDGNSSRVPYDGRKRIWKSGRQYIIENWSSGGGCPMPRFPKTSPSNHGRPFVLVLNTVARRRFIPDVISRFLPPLIGVLAFPFHILSWLLCCYQIPHSWHLFQSLLQFSPIHHIGWICRILVPRV